MTGIDMRRFTPTLLLSGIFSCGPPAWAGAIGTDFLFECAQCSPTTAEHFVGKVGPADYQAVFDGYPWYEVDVEASTIAVKSLVEGATRSPLIFRLTWSPAQYRLADATISPTSSFQTGYSWGQGELIIDMGDRYFLQGDQIVFDLTAASVPEPASWLLAVLGTASLLWRRARNPKCKGAP